MKSSSLPPIHRRQFLRGLGAAVSLPALASLSPLPSLGASPSQRLLATTASGMPLRTAFLYFPNGAIPECWWPQNPHTTEAWQSSETLKPLDSLQSHCQLLGGLDQKNADPGPDGAGDHARGSSVFLTGVRLRKSATDLQAAASIDQLIAREVGSMTRFPSLELTCDAVRKSGACDSGYACAYQFNISWSSPTTPMTPEANPRLLFERLFGSGNHGDRAASLKQRQAEQHSILDFVMDQARSVQKRLDARDREKLDQYLTGVREVEVRIQKAERFGTTPDPNLSTPAGIPESYEEYLQLMFDMLVLAFQTDSTRVASMILAHDGSNRSFAEIGIPEGHHDLSHHQNKTDLVKKVATIDQWYVKQLSRFLDKMNRTLDASGESLLHNSMIVYGSGNADGNRHTHTNLPLILAGHGGGTLRPGRWVQHGGKPASNLFLGLAERMGVTHLTRVGDSSGVLGQI